MLRRFVLTVTVALMGIAAPPAQAQNAALFIGTNSPDPVRGNEIVMYQIRDGGDLRLQGRFPTGGIGSGPGRAIRGYPLGTQGSMVSTDDGNDLMQTNWRRDAISPFRLNRDGLVRADVERSRLGEQPLQQRRSVQEQAVLTGHEGERRDEEQPRGPAQRGRLGAGLIEVAGWRWTIAVPAPVPSFFTYLHA